VVNYNGLNAIEACLRSLLELEPAPAEIIVVDNASTDGSRELVRERFPQVRLVELPDNRGPCVARNRGLEEARTRLVYQVDGDIVSPRNVVQILAGEMVSRPGTVLAQPRVLFDGDRERIHYDGASFHYAGVMTLRHFYALRAEADPRTQEVNAAISAALLVDREAVLELGGYDPAFFILYEDHDLSYRVRLRGGKILVVPRAVVYHREGTAGISYRKGPQYPARRVYLQSRNRWLALYRNHRLRTLIVTLPGVLLFDLLWLAFAVKQRTAGSFLRGKWHALLALGAQRPARRAIQRTRRLRDRDLLGAAPLTFSPLIARGLLERVVERSVNVCLRAWWALVRWIAG
jgi:GT2 family glycosyltransferase